MIKQAHLPIVASGLFLTAGLALGTQEARAQQQAQTTVGDGTQAQRVNAGTQYNTAPMAQSAPVVQETPVETLHGSVSEANPASNGNSQRVIQTASSPNVKPYVPSEFEKYVSDVAGKPLRRFGAELIVPELRNFTSPPNTAIPANYRINAGDEIVIGLTGSVQANDMRLTVSNEGQVFVPQVGAITVAGIPYAQLQSLIQARVGRQYRNFTLNVSLGTLRGITVYVTGFVANPGSYTVSSLSTLVNALLTAGGPGPSGSFRSIQVRRDGKLIADFDLYDFLLKGDDRGDITMQNGDIITVAPAGAQIAAIGSVNREAIYEVRANDSLTDVLKYAGGANTVADLSRVQLLDPQLTNGWQQLIPTTAAQTQAGRGMIVRVLSAVGIAQPSHNLQSLVTVSGEVNKPGRYFVAPGTTLDQMVQVAGGLTQEAYPYGAVFVRDSLRREQQNNYDRAIEQMRATLLVQPLVRANSGQSDDAQGRVTIMKELIGELSSHHIDGRLVLPIGPTATQVPGSFTVENNDALFIPGRKLEVSVFGMVNSSSNFLFVVGRTINDYIGIAGGFARYADKHHIFVVRANGMLLSGSVALKAQVLPGDLVFVPINSDQGIFWSHVRDLSGGLLNGLVAAAAIKAVS